MLIKVFTFISLTILIENLFVIGLPVTPTKKTEPPETHDSNENAKDLQVKLEYERYLKEVVDALETDPEFKKKLNEAEEVDIRSGKIALELEYVGHSVRSKLDEIKRRELQRLSDLATQQFELTNDIDRTHLKIGEHVDHKNEHTFEIRDLEKLIFKSLKDLAEADKKRREEFKQYEMQKEFEKQQVLNELDEQNRKKFEHELEEKKEKHNKHEKLHHPGNQAQLEEVWEKQDHMEGQEFDPKAFFMIHDLDDNGVWDETELKALFTKELDKVYQQGLPEDDMRERAEEMERMREHVYREMDKDKNGLISYKEFLDQTKSEEFRKDPEWETVDNTPQFTHDEYLEFERKRKEEIDRLIAQGVIPPHPNMPNGYYPNQHPNAIPPQGGQYQQQQYHPNAPQQGQQLHYQQQQNYPNQYHNAPPQGQNQQHNPNNAQQPNYQHQPNSNNPPPQYQQPAPVQYQPQGPAANNQQQPQLNQQQPQHNQQQPQHNQQQAQQNQQQQVPNNQGQAGQNQQQQQQQQQQPPQNAQGQGKQNTGT